eukprot:6195590-Pleurochrysis_carterae.AAC.3
MAVLKAITLRMIDSIAQVDNSHVRCAGWCSLGACELDCEQLGSGGRSADGDASGGGERCSRAATGSECGVACVPERPVKTVEVGRSCASWFAAPTRAC